MKKTLLCFLFITLLFNIFFLKPYVANAAPLGTLVKATSGSNAEKIILGVYEQSGVKLTSNSARQQAVDRWRLEAYNRFKSDTASGKNAELWSQINTIDATTKNLPVTSIPEKPGFGRVLLDWSLYASVFMLSYDATTSLIDMYKQNKEAEFIADNYDKLVNPVGYNNIFGISTFYEPNIYGNPDLSGLYLIAADSTHMSNKYISWINKAIFPVLYITKFNKISSNKISLTYFYSRWADSGLVSGNVTETSTVNYNLDDYKETDYKAMPIQISDFTLPKPLDDISKSDSLPQKKPSTMPDKIPVVIPLDTNPDAYNSPDSWNKPLVESVPTPDPLPVPDPNPRPVQPDDPTTKPGDTKNRWGKLVTNKFPFSLPWDVYNILSCLAADPKVPEYHVNQNFKIMGVSMPFKFDVKLDQLDKYIGFFRTMILIGYALFLIYKTRSLLGGGQ